jgi:hypothetical protein
MFFALEPQRPRDRVDSTIKTHQVLKARRVPAEVLGELAGTLKPVAVVAHLFLDHVRLELDLECGGWMTHWT